MSFWMYLIGGVLAGFAGAIGIGGGGILIVFLTVFSEISQKGAQGINLLFFLPIAAVSVVVYAIKRQIEWKTVLISAGIGLFGAVLGSLLSSVISGDLLRKIFAVILIVLGIKQLTETLHRCIFK